MEYCKLDVKIEKLVLEYFYMRWATYVQDTCSVCSQTDDSVQTMANLHSRHGKTHLDEFDYTSEKVKKHLLDGNRRFAKMLGDSFMPRILSRNQILYHVSRRSQIEALNSWRLKLIKMCFEVKSYMQLWRSLIFIIMVFTSTNILIIECVKIAEKFC